MALIKSHIELILMEILCHLKTKKISLTIDASLQNNYMVPQYRQMVSPKNFEISLFDFVNYMGFSRNSAPTSTIKFPLAVDLLKNIQEDSDELRISIHQVNDESVDDKREISWRMGDGLSLVLAEKLYNLEKNRIWKVNRRGNKSKPDFKGFSGNTKVVWEAKGSINSPRQSTIHHARGQKSKELANAKFCSFATLRSESISEVLLKDPPSLPLEGDELERKIAKAKHYVDVFNFIGQPELSRYFLLMADRLKYDKSFPEYPEKEKRYRKIIDESTAIEINGKKYLGTIRRLDGTVFLYVGFDERLLPVYDFINFEDYPNDIISDNSNEENIYRISKDGICYGLLKNVSSIIEEPVKIPYYRENWSIRDLDQMLHFELVDHLSYLFEQEGFEIINRQHPERNKQFDLVLRKKVTFLVEIKKDVILKSFELLKKIKMENTGVLITTSVVSAEDIEFARVWGIIVIDRRALVTILREKPDQKRITNYINRMTDLKIE